ncbi:MAG: malto-oligosyltrehalose synthase [Candidatus Margulisbacteria bacterium GWF2_38_17]|nr:MAG: malto-oligosyltrehalose synthase [Candidatus Margulisbacteria bacterium GWF2_38_17]OGI11064.1 MAG: malto-oligosyltrehalose synthase [Candidatus Margulisbacteria bacterium GWE2_39_32]
MRVPISTYRLQFNHLFDFDCAEKIVPYLKALGISDIYASPILKAKKGSMHGYDVVDYHEIDSRLGGLEGFEQLIETIKKYDLGWIQDIVPNHMAFNEDNPILMDVLEYGRDSAYYGYFDIIDGSSYAGSKGKVLAPFLGKFYGVSLEDGEIRLGYDKGRFNISYYDLQFPLRIETYAAVLSYNLTVLESRLGKDHPDFIKYLGIVYILTSASSDLEISTRHMQIDLAKKMLWEFYQGNEVIKSFIDETITLFNGVKGVPSSFDLLDKLHADQLFRLSYWKVAAEETNYRRFFNINELISLRVEEPEVFDAVHSLIFNLIKRQLVTGLRIDHIDGLFDPTHYLKRIREFAPDSYIVVEKILESGENISPLWEIQGTTGYDFMNFVNGIFCSTENLTKFKKIYFNFSETRTRYEDLLRDKKKLIIERYMAGDIDNLSHHLKRISYRYRYGNDITVNGLRRTLSEVMVLFPVYRTYITHDSFSSQDWRYIHETIAKAKQRVPDLLYELNFIERFLLLIFDNYLTEEERNQWIDFVMRFQQFTSPLMAKGVEDTVLYLYNILISLNEVGGGPDEFGVTPSAFHKFNQRRQESTPVTFNATATHDTKRGEDVRARVNVLSELPQEWDDNIKLWHTLNEDKKTRIDDSLYPDNNDEYFLYQTLIGTFPFLAEPGILHAAELETVSLADGETSERSTQFSDEDYETYKTRIKAYMLKAVREAKLYTEWLNPNPRFEEACMDFIEGILMVSDANQFIFHFLIFQKKIAFFGIFNSLSQLLIKVTSPGVPDFYQGTELWELNLVDPDNRRPVDFALRQEILYEIEQRDKTDRLEFIQELLGSKHDGRIKMFLMYKLLHAREANRELFLEGNYVSLETGGYGKDHILAFARNYGDAWAVAVVPLFLTGLVAEGQYPFGYEIWKDTSVSVPGNVNSWRNSITGETLSPGQKLFIGDVFRYFPCALLIST